MPNDNRRVTRSQVQQPKPEAPRNPQIGPGNVPSEDLASGGHPSQWYEDTLSNRSNPDNSGYFHDNLEVFDPFACKSKLEHSHDGTLRIPEDGFKDTDEITNSTVIPGIGKRGLNETNPFRTKTPPASPVASREETPSPPPLHDRQATSESLKPRAKCCVNSATTQAIRLRGVPVVLDAKFVRNPGTLPRTAPPKPSKPPRRRLQLKHANTATSQGIRPIVVGP
ncbi:hypothetical protein QAD02_021408 [Eretmocerus hayati]|uniref:Uncharacterized protein n=1 Tax=Eretmocerus hayati TaxID=131215 RepID=A0ACC2PPV1_9HYME|nr:hypothetical protein QAD02_021408 [Eretmocerus hayati]